MGKRKTESGGGYEHTIEVKYGSVSIGKEVARISVSMDDVDLDDAVVSDLFRNSELQVELVCVPNAGKDAKGQQIMDCAELRLPCTARAHGYSTNADGHSTSLQISKNSIELNKLGDFAGATGHLRCSRVGPAKAVTLDD